MKLLEEKLVPELRFPEFSGKWEEKKLGDIVKFHRGTSLSKADLSVEGNPCILYGELYTTYQEVIKNIVSRTNSDKKLFLSEINDVIIPSSGETAEDISCASALLVKDVALGGDLNILRPNNEMVNGSYLSYMLNSVKKWEIAKIAQGASVVHVYSSGLSKLDISVASIEEQEKIANFFTLIDNKIEKQEEKVVNLEEYKQGMMQKIFNQEIRFKDEDGEDYPEWEEKKLGEQCSFFSGGTPSSKNSNYYDGNIPFIKSGEINFNETESFLTKEGFKNSSAKLVDIGDVLYALYGATSGEVGISKIKGAINQAVLCIRTIEIDNDYLVQLLRNKKNYIIMTYIQGGQGNLSANIIKSLSFKFPTMREQEKISSMLLIIDLKIDKEKEKLDSLKEFKEGLMQKMFI